MAASSLTSAIAAFRRMMFRATVRRASGTALDAILGLDVERALRDVEVELRTGAAPWGDAYIWQDVDSPAHPMTPYAAFADLLDVLALPDGATIVDLGSGVGRTGLATGVLKPTLRAIGYEVVEPRVRVAQQAARRLGIDDRVTFVTADLEHTGLPDADVYYAFNPFNVRTGHAVAARLRAIAARRSFRLVVLLAFHGIDDVAVDWLSGPEHHAGFAIYQTRPS